VLPQTSDSLPRSIGGPALVIEADGLWSGGDPLHRDILDNQRFGQLAAPLVARVVLANSGGDTLTAIPTGIPTMGGPVVTNVYRQSNTTLVVTVQHDCGTDLIVPANTQAPLGSGWAVMDGGTVASPGTIVQATACVRLNPTQLQLTLSQALANPSADCRLFYPYGTYMMGRGNAVTDNLSTLTPPAGWNLGSDLGIPSTNSNITWNWNMPVHVPMLQDSGVVLSDTPSS
jgi:hypothetical protein